MNRVLVALGAVLLDLEAIRIIASVLARDVVAIFAVFTRESDLGTNIVAGHCGPFHLMPRAWRVAFVVPRAGLEPATQRL